MSKHVPDERKPSISFWFFVIFYSDFFLELFFPDFIYFFFLNFNPVVFFSYVESWRYFFQYMSGTCLGTHLFTLSLQDDLTSFEFYRFHPKLNGSSCDSFPFFQKPKPKIEQVKKQYFPSKAKEHTLFQASISGPKYQL